jgi:1,2-diacylglycerol 3-alpha-glucosyltransferase
MNVLMLTNTYTPHVGGVARSVASFTAEYRRVGNRVLVIAPEFENMPAHETDVVRIPAIQHFNGSDFSVPVPAPVFLSSRIDEFQPEIVHSHHSFLLGDTALRIAARRCLPIVFTHHTRYDQYAHYVPGDSALLRRFAVELAAGYANLCDAVIAPSQSIAQMLRAEGVQSAIEVIPTGVDVARFGHGDRVAARDACGIPRAAFVVGHVGRLAVEKNLPFLARAVASFLQQRSGAHFLIAGTGSAQAEVERILGEAGVASRCHIIGVLTHEELSNVYHCFDVFAFASQSETQGMVLTEAMAAGVPVVAVDAAGVREVVDDRSNGRLLDREDPDEFVTALAWVADLNKDQRLQLRQSALATAERFSLPRTAAQALRLYETLCQKGPANKQPTGDGPWATAIRRFHEEWRIWSNVAGALGTALTADRPPEQSAP